MAEEPEHLLVVSGRADDTVVMSERDPAHPDGEAFVGAKYNGRGELVPVAVGKTARVLQLLHSGELVEVDNRGKPKNGDVELPDTFLPVTLGSGERPIGETNAQRDVRLTAATTGGAQQEAATTAAKPVTRPVG